MTILWINLTVVSLFAFLSRYTVNSRLASDIPVFIEPNKILITLATMTLIIVSGLRSNIGDTYFYRHIYEFNTLDWNYISSQKDIGFGILQMLLKAFVSEDSQILLITTALITNILIVMVLYKYSRMIDLSLYVYITGGLFLVSMNGIRQVLAAAIAFTATKFIIEGNWKKYGVVIIFASLFHQSALILLPIYFLVRFKAWSKTSLALVVLAVIFVIGFETFSTMLFSAIEDTQYGGYKDFAEGGANIIRVVVEAVPMTIVFLGREKFRKIFPESDYFVNMALIGFVFMLIATQNWIFARFSIYFGFYQLILISWIVKLFREKDEKFVYYALLLCYFAYYYFENVITLNIHYRSDYLIW